ncbi:amino acid adenylation domain-containing protein [Streptomyces sp. NPDC085944]|uniref:amino acid adenylation domain-containing protein n=1 Tax=Streptomyces sp. NPDC085944 TaxID=3154962 RepID=UPI00342AA648
MRALVFARHGDPARVLRQARVAVPEPAAGEVRLRMAARPVNPSDLLFVQGRYGRRARFTTRADAGSGPSGDATVAVAGFEGAGVVDALGPDTSGPPPGTRVAVAADGTWQEYVCVPPTALLRVTEALPLDAACQLTVNPFTARLLLDDLQLREGETLLLTAGASAVGRMTAWLAGRRGVRCLAAVRRAGPRPAVERSGALPLHARTGAELSATVRQATRERGVHAVLDAVGGSLGGSALRCVRPGGRFVSYGLLSGDPLPVPPEELIFRRVRVSGFWLPERLKRLERQGPEHVGRLADEIGSAVAAGLPGFEVAARYVRPRPRPGTRDAAGRHREGAAHRLTRAAPPLSPARSTSAPRPTRGRAPQPPHRRRFAMHDTASRDRPVPDHVRRWNATAADYPRNALIPGLFAERAERDPDADALLWPDGRWTYHQLRERVRRTAAHLRARGVGDGDTVAMLLERSPDAVVAALGILEAGGVYLPLDPKHPDARLASVLKDSGTGHVIAAPGTGLPGESTAVLVTPGEAAAHPLPSRDTRWTGGRRATDAAYLVYTSGSTGAPKGVVCTHRGLVRFAAADHPAVPGPGERLLATTNPTFDVSCYEIFCTLLNGACLVLPEPETPLDPAALGLALREQGITVVWLSAGLFHQHAQAAPGMFAGLRCLMAGGDALSPSAVRAVLGHGRPRFLVNGYGPSENAVISTTHVIEELPPHAELVPIGTPLPNTTAYVVRRDGRPAAVGEEGELWLGGDGVALGYLNEPGKTAERFVVDRFGDDPEGRLYRTGDMARWRADGVLEFLGRRDRQVQLRGYRVELDEIEHVLSAVSDVREAAVDVLGEGGGERLGAAVACAPDADTAALVRRLHAHARDRLPAYMVPARIVATAELPLTTSGKADRDRLLALLTAPQSTGTDGDAPRGGDEEAVARIWRERLGVDAVGRDDDLFALGGTSLLATQVAAAARSHFGIPARHSTELLRSLLDNATLAAFTARARELGDCGGRPVGAGERPDFAAEARLAPGLRFTVPKAAWAEVPGNVLLTGGTGFLGVHLIAGLVRAGAHRVYCLTRARDTEEGHRRIAARMRRYGLDASACEDRVVPVPGELSEPHFGLGDAAWDELARACDLVVHSGTSVNFAYPYRALAPVNVDGTRTVLELAGTHRLKTVHHISTIGVIAGFGTAGVRHVSEDTPLDYPDRFSLGYMETKWVAERLVGQAAERGLPVAVHRPYEITGTSDRGVWNTDTMMCALFRTIAESGLAPDIPLPLDFVPVDYTADVITRVITHEKPDGRVYHITNPRDARLGLLVERLRAMGYRVEHVPYDTWVDTVARWTAEDPEHPMAPYIPMFTEPAYGADMSVKEMYFAGTFPAFDRHNTERATAGGGLECPPVDARLLDLNLHYLRDVGYLPPPEAQVPAR